MAFGGKAKTDYFGLADDNLIVDTNNDNASASSVSIVGQNGELVLVESFGNTTAPSADYIVAGDVSWAADAKSLGTVSGTNTKVTLSKISINTTGGAAPTFSASGEEVESTASTGCVFKIPALSLKKVHHAQTLFSAFTFTGAGVHLTAANYNIEATVTKATKDGACVAFDVSSGKIDASLTFRAIGNAAPTVTPGQGWVVTAPLAESNPDSDYPTYTITLTKPLTKTDAS